MGEGFFLSQKAMGDFGCLFPLPLALELAPV